jgi:hypothetical protein
MPGHGIVGREGEPALVKSFIGSVSEGPSALLLEGAAGIGKTTLWHAGVSIARARGHRVLACRGELRLQAPWADPSCRELIAIPKRGWACENDWPNRLARPARLADVLRGHWAIEALRRHARDPRRPLATVGLSLVGSGAIGAAQTMGARCSRSGSWRRSGRR